MLLNPDLINTQFLFIASSFVFIMQGGFLLLETGLVRAKNSINVAAKNLVDTCIASLVFILISSKIVFYDELSISELFDLTYLESISNRGEVLSFILFQALFCATTITIISGAIAERVKFSSYAFISFISALIIYPLYARLCWNGIAVGKPIGYLAEMGFVDFAGSIVVHATGGWIALALLIIIGPRIGRFDKNGKPSEFFSSNLSIATFGTLLLWFGWFGFNVGSSLAPTESLPVILINTFVAAAASLIFSLILKTVILKRKIEIPYLLNAILAGAVAITASSPYVGILNACFIGILGGIFCFIGEQLLLKYKIDDAVSAIPVHLFAGVVGALCLPFFIKAQYIPFSLSRFDHFLVQLQGVVINAAWAFGSAFLIFWVWNKFYPMRVSVEDEKIGLDISQHHAKTEMSDILNFFKHQTETGALKNRLILDPFTDLGVIGSSYNKVLDKLENVGIELGNKNKSLERFAGRVSHDLKNSVGIIMGFSELIRDEISKKNNNERETLMDYSTEIIEATHTINKTIHSYLNLAINGLLIEGLEKIEIRLVVKNVEKNLLQEIKRNNITFQFNIMEPYVLAKEIFLLNIFTNIISNAIKYKSDNRPSIINFTSEKINNEIVISIIDNGIGIKQDKLGEIFNLFSRVHDENDVKIEGHGIGLNSVKLMIESIGAKFDVTSTFGVGTKFKIYFPQLNI